MNKVLPLLLACSLGSAQAAVIVLPESTSNATAYSTNYTAVVPFSTVGEVGQRPSRDLMQTFTVGASTTIYGLELVMDQANATRSITFNLYDVDVSGNASAATQDLSSLSALRTEGYTFTAADATNAATGFPHLLQWTFSSLTLDSSRTYALMISDSAASETNSFRWKYNTGSTTAYAGGAAYGYSGSGSVWNQTLFSPNTRDLTLAFTTVPEPSVSGVLALGLALLGSRRRRPSRAA
jgi:hypothetical protein